MSLPIELKEKIFDQFVAKPSHFIGQTNVYFFRNWHQPKTRQDFEVAILTLRLTPRDRMVLDFRQLDPALSALLIDSTPDNRLTELRLQFSNDDLNTIVERTPDARYLNTRAITEIRDRRLMFLKTVRPDVAETNEEAMLRLLNGDSLNQDVQNFNDDVVVMEMFNTTHKLELLRASVNRSNFAELVMLAVCREPIRTLPTLEQFVDAGPRARTIYTRRIDTSLYERDQRAELELCDPACIIYHLDTMLSPSHTQLELGMMMSTTDEIFVRHELTDQALRYYVLRARRLRFIPKLLDLPDFLLQIAFFKCPELYLYKTIPADYRYLVFHTMDASQIGGYFHTHRQDPTADDFPVMVTKRAEGPWLGHLPANLHQQVIARCTSHDELVAVFNSLTNPSQYIIYITLLKSGVNRFGLELGDEFDGRNLSLMLYYDSIGLTADQYMEFRRRNLDLI